jgi:hypothetical protein
MIWEEFGKGGYGPFSRLGVILRGEGLSCAAICQNLRDFEPDHE